MLLLLVLLSAFVTRRWLRVAGCLSVFHAIAAALDGNRLGMVQEPVEQSGGQYLVAQERPPLRKAGITGQNNRALFVAITHQGEEQIGLLFGQLGVAHLVNDEHLSRKTSAAYAL
jgi:hypothetical protein